VSLLLNFWKFANIGRSNAGIKESLEEMVKDCQVLDFPQVRHDFSDTKIYWRQSSSELDKS
jgi:hypothetical protein